MAIEMLTALFVALMVFTLLSYVTILEIERGTLKVGYWRMMATYLATTLPPIALFVFGVANGPNLLVQCLSGTIAAVWLVIGLLYVISLSKEAD
jgi:hypothetical protein